MKETNIITYDKKIAKLLGEKLSDKPIYHKSTNKIKKMVGKLFNMDGIKLMFDGKVVGKRSVPDSFQRFEINHNGVMYTHMLIDTYTDEEKIYHTVGAFLQDIMSGESFAN